MSKESHIYSSNVDHHHTREGQQHELELLLHISSPSSVPKNNIATTGFGADGLLECEGDLEEGETKKKKNIDSRMDYKSGSRGGDNGEAKRKLMKEAGDEEKSGSSETLEEFKSFTNAAYNNGREDGEKSDQESDNYCRQPVTNTSSPAVVAELERGDGNNGNSSSLENSINSKGNISCGGGAASSQVIVEPNLTDDRPRRRHSSTSVESFQWNQRHQVFAALAANMGAMALGTVASWTATALPSLRKSGAQLGKISKTEESWIGSIMTLGAMLSCPVAGLGIEKVGRRMTMLLLTLPFLAGWLVIFFAQDVPMIYAGRFITGFCGGAFTIAAPVFITETSDLNIRGALGSGFDMMITVGILYIFLVGTFTSWRVQAISCGLIPAVFHALMSFVPESPRYLVEKGKVDEASKAIAWFRSPSATTNDSQVQEELMELRKSVEDSRAGGEVTWRDLFRPSVIKPTSICFALMFFQQLSGIDAVMFYTVDIFHSAGSDVDENLATNIVGAVQVAATVTAALIVDNRGRRLLLLLSAIFMVISLSCMGLYFYLKKNNGGIPPENLGWIPLSSLMVYVIAFSIGFGPIPWLMLGELIPPRVKGLAAGIVTMARWVLGFVVTLAFQDVMVALGEHGGYWLLASFCVVATLYTFFFVPETKGKSLDEIQMLFNKSEPDSACA